MRAVGDAPAGCWEAAAKGRMRPACTSPAACALRAGHSDTSRVPRSHDLQAHAGEKRSRHGEADAPQFSLPDATRLAVAGGPSIGGGALFVEVRWDCSSGLASLTCRGGFLTSNLPGFMA